MIPLLILGLLKQNPGAYGYELLALMKKQNYQFIVNFTKGSFYYNLQQLEEKGLIQITDSEQTATVKETNNYVITALGDQEFKKLIHKYGSVTGYISLPFYAAMLFSNEYDSADFLSLVELQISQSKEKISLIDEALISNELLPTNFRKMLENSRAHHIVNVEWFENLLDKSL